MLHSSKLEHYHDENYDFLPEIYSRKATASGQENAYMHLLESMSQITGHSAAGTTKPGGGGGVCHILNFFPTSNAKRSTIKAFLAVRFSFISLYSEHCFLKFLKICRKFHWIGLLNSSKLVYLEW